MAGQFELPLAVDLAAVALGATQGAAFATRMAEERRLDMLGIVIVGIASGLGGGIIRDILLNEIPAALRGPSYLPVVLGAALAGMLLSKVIARMDRVVLGLDALALGAYLVVGTAKAASSGLDGVAAIFVGVLACTGGTVIRDVLLRTEVSLVQVGSLYAIAAVAGGAVYIIMDDLVPSFVAGVVAMTVTALLRMAALLFDWHSPRPLAIDRGFVRRAASRRP